MHQPKIWTAGARINWSPVPKDIPTDILLEAYCNLEIELEVRVDGIYWRRDLNEDRELGL